MRGQFSAGALGRPYFCGDDFLTLVSTVAPTRPISSFSPASVPKNGYVRRFMQEVPMSIRLRLAFALLLASFASISFATNFTVTA
ncbi:MAG TPA: hypothetical protein VF132_04060, partial [Rudaea sp.]